MSKKTKPEAEEQEQVKTEAPAEETAKADVFLNLLNKKEKP